nr:SDR family NAD(P)-dependent oxidoreductase [Dankookia rubra]
MLVADLLPDRAECVAAEITAAGLRAALFTLDVAEEDQAAAAVADVEARFGPLRLAVCNAGITSRVPALEMSRAAFERTHPAKLSITHMSAVSRPPSRVRYRRGATVRAIGR